MAPTRATPTLTARRFTPHIEDKALDALRCALETHELPPKTYESTRPECGVTHDWMKSTLKHWATSFDYRKLERERVQAVDHFLTEVDGFTIHFVAHFSTDPEAVPLLLLHGWPGSFLEFVDVVRLLSQSTSPAFHVVVPTQPGFPGWSSPPPIDRDFKLLEVARLMDKLMTGLGFSSYVAQGGDIGSVLARLLAVHCDACVAAHVNYLPLLPPDSNLPPIVTNYLPGVVSQTLATVATRVLGGPDTYGLTPREIANARKAIDFAATGRGYGVMQGTRPATIGFAVASSPISLLAWLGEKFRDWVDSPLPLDELLLSVTLWWCFKSYPSAIYAYAQFVGGVGPYHRRPDLFITKPFGFSSFHKEIASAPQAWARQTGNLVFYRYHEKAGHFAALEEPVIFAKDMQDFCRKHFKSRA